MTEFLDELFERAKAVEDIAARRGILAAVYVSDGSELDIGNIRIRWVGALVQEAWDFGALAFATLRGDNRTLVRVPPTIDVDRDFATGLPAVSGFARFFILKERGGVESAMTSLSHVGYVEFIPSLPPAACGNLIG